MKHANVILFAALVVTTCFCLLTIACDGESELNGPGNGDDYSVLIATANDSLGNQMFDLIENTIEDADSTLRPRDVDFTELHNLYLRISNQYPDGLDAKFGSAFTGLMLFLQDPDLNNLVDRFKYVYDTLTFNALPPLEWTPRFGGGGPLFVDGLPLHGDHILRLLPSLVSIDNAAIDAAASDPMISELQAILESGLLPKIVASRQRMADVLADTDYTFIVTPKMQGNEGADFIELDKSDFQVLQAGLYAAEAGLRVFFSRDLDIVSYQDVGVTEAARQNSGFLDLKQDGIGLNHMQAARDLILEASDHLETALNSLINEVGTDQFNDLIQVYPHDLSDLYEIRDSLISYRHFFDGPRVLTVVFNDKADTFSTLVDINQFFNNPMDNPKRFVPSYTVTIEAMSGFYKSYAGMYFSRDRYWAAMDSIYGLTRPNDTDTWSGDTSSFSNHLPETDSDEFYRLLGELSDWYIGDYGCQQFVFGWDDVEFMGWGDPRDPWSYSSQRMWQYLELYKHPEQVRICYEWVADTFEDWDFPDPTFNGLMPNLTNPEIRDLVRDLGIDWKKADCDTTYFDDLW
ncbi:MAG: hypothetical protein KAT58_05890 [candidate division Zixibacteria bacterium]|nr:hypothetical protein [candidate division Zixibacteria bacterium]